MISYRCDIDDKNAFNICSSRWPNGLARCVKIVYYHVVVGSNPSSDTNIVMGDRYYGSKKLLKFLVVAYCVCSYCFQ